MMEQTTTSSIKLMSKIVTLAEQKPITAIVMGLIVFGIFIGSVSFASTFLGKKTAIASEVAAIKAEMEVSHRFYEKAIVEVKSQHVTDINKLQDDGKLQTPAEIKLIFKDELEKFRKDLLYELRQNKIILK